MAYKIIWSAEADKTFEANIKYLEDNWSENEIINFVNKSFEIIDVISKTPLLFKQSKTSKRIRKALIVKQISLYYRINNSKNTIELITFWNNFQNPKKLKL